MKNSKILHVSLWVAQVLLAVAFFMAGFMKITGPIDELAAGGMTFVNSFSEGMVRFIGICEVLGAIGLLLPSILRIQPILSPIAALGLATIMVFAMIYHITHNETIAPNVVLLAIASFVAWGRMKKVPIQPKSA